MRRGWLRAFTLVFAIAAALAGLGRGAAAEGLSAEKMVAACKELLSTAKKTDDPDAVELDNTFQTGSCWGAFLSIQQLIAFKMEGARASVFRVCVPEDATLVQIIQLFAAYVRRHPERQGEPFTVVALAALHEAYRCKG